MWTYKMYMKYYQVEGMMVDLKISVVKFQVWEEGLPYQCH